MSTSNHDSEISEHETSDHETSEHGASSHGALEYEASNNHVDDSKPSSSSDQTGSEAPQSDTEAVETASAQSYLKRKEHPDAQDDQPARRGRVLSSPSQVHYYREFFNEAILQHVTRFTRVEVDPDLPPSQNGVSRWSQGDKAVLFAALERYGPNDPMKLAKLVKSKSPVEVGDYLLLLHDADEEAGLSDITNQSSYTTRLEDIPAAAEISDECLKAEEEMAKKLGKLVDGLSRDREKQYRAQNGAPGLHIIDRELAESSEGACILASKRYLEAHDDDYDDEEEQRQEKEEAKDVTVILKSNAESEDLAPSVMSMESNNLHTFPAAQLFDLPKWCELSEKLFMNAGGRRESEHWARIHRRFGGPGIYLTAVEDFHALACSFTQRILQAAMFQCASRLRATDYSDVIKGTKDQSLRTSDIEAALAVLGLPRNIQEVIGKSARKCGVVVSGNPKDVMSANNERELSYDEVEALLFPHHSNNPTEPSSSTGPPAEMPQVNAEEAAGDRSDSYSPLHFIDTVEAESYFKDGKLLETPRNSQHDVDLQEEEEAEQADQVDRLVEEQRLRTAVGLPPLLEPLATSADQIEEDSKAARYENKGPATKYRIRSATSRIRKQTKVSDWRDRVEYLAEWERFGVVVPQAEFTAMEEQGRLNRAERSEVLRYPIAKETCDVRMAEEIIELQVEQEGEVQDGGDDYTIDPALATTGASRQY